MTHNAAALPEARSVARPSAQGGKGGVVFALLGGYTLFMQIILVRASFTLFTGNELSLALQLGLWLAFTATGGALGAWLSAGRVYILLTLLPWGGVWAQILVRLLPAILPVEAGREVPLGWAVLCLGLAQFPLNVTAGALFPTLCRLFGGSSEGRAIRHYYMLESLGGVVAGGAFTFLLTGNFDGFSLGLGASAAVALGAAAPLWHAGRRSHAAILLLSAALMGLGGFGGLAKGVDKLWWQTHNPGSTHLGSLETPYQRIDLGLRDGQHTIYCNGIPALAIEDVQESMTGYRSADLYLSFHPEPKRILVIGGGEPMLVARMLEYPVEQIVYVVLDPGLLDLIRPLSSQQAIGNDPRLSLVPDDGRAYLRHAKETFDLIVLDLPTPVSASGNRYFTVQAFSAAQSRLRAGGLLLFQLPASSHYLAGDTQRLLASIYRALSLCFRFMSVVPGDMMVFVAGSQEISRGLDELADRFAGRGVPLVIAEDRMIEESTEKRAAFLALYSDQFNPFRHEQQLAELQALSTGPNDDAHPIAYHLNLRKWLSEMSSGSGRADTIFHAAEWLTAVLMRYGMRVTLGTALALACAAGWLMRRKPSTALRTRRWALGLAIFSSGWAGMLGELAIVFMYQNVFGQLYYAIGALFATYMAGLVVGSAAVTGRLQERRGTWLIVARAFMVVSCGTAILASQTESSPAIFLGLFLYSLILGLEYPLANRIYREDTQGVRAAGILHSMDHFGAAAATLLGGTLILPLVGPQSTLLGIACFHIVMLGLLLPTVGGARPRWFRVGGSSGNHRTSARD